MPEKRVLSDAELILAPTVSSSLAAIRELLKGIEVKVAVDGKPATGYIHSLEFAKGSDHLFAVATVADPENEENRIDIEVSIDEEGEVNIMPNQDEV